MSCYCGGFYYDIDFERHISQNEHHFEFLDTIEIDCQCGPNVKYNYSNQHNHFKLNSHKTWESHDSKRYYQVLVICKCGMIMPYGKRIEHNTTHPKTII